MQALMILAVLLSLVAVGAHIWLTVLAFKRHVGWGLAVFFLSPFAAVFFAIRAWEQAKKPFLAYAGSAVMSLGLVVIVFARLGGLAMMSMAQGMEAQDLSEEQVAELMVDTMDKWQDSGLFHEADEQKMEQMKHVLKTEFAGENASAQASLIPSAPSRPSTRKPGANADNPDIPQASNTRRNVVSSSASAAQTPPRRSGVIAFDEAGDFIGRFVEVQTFAGRTYRGILNEVDARVLTLEQHTAAGSMAFQLGRGEIQTLNLSWQ